MNGKRIGLVALGLCLVALPLPREACAQGVPATAEEEAGFAAREAGSLPVAEFRGGFASAAALIIPLLELSVRAAALVVVLLGKGIVALVSSARPRR